MLQMLFVVLAIALLGSLLLPVAEISLSRQQVLMSTEAGTTATAVGQELIEEICVRKFDQNKCGRTDSALTPTVFTSSASLGPEASDSGKYNDIDDFNGYSSVVQTPRLGSFYDTVSVYYVTANNPDVVYSGQTFLKRIDVKVWSPYLPTQGTAPASVVVSKIVSYRYRGGS